MSEQQFVKKQLKNGLTLLMVPAESATSVTMSVFVKAGSRYEPAKINGISHFLEHLHFKGSKKFPSAKKLSETVDAVGGEFNANTGKEHTQYYIRAAAHHLPLVIEVLTDMVQNPLFDQAEIDREKGVIIEEINMYKDNPQIHVESLFEDLMWPGTALGRDIAGTPEVIKSINRPEVVDYRNKYYQPSNMIIALAGKFEVAEAEKLIEQNWAKLTNKKTSVFAPVKFAQDKPQLIVQNKVTEQAHMVVGFKAFAYQDKNNYPLRVMSAVLGGGMSSRLFLRIRERLGLAYYVYSSYNNYLDAGNFVVQAGLKVSSAPKALEVILDELAKIRDQGITSAELTKAKDYLKGKMALSMEDPHNKMEWFLSQEAFLNRIRTLDQVFADLDKVTKEDVSKVAKLVLNKKNLNLAVIGPFADQSVFAEKLTI